MSKINVGDTVLPNGWGRTVTVIEVLENVFACLDELEYSGSVKTEVVWMTPNMVKLVDHDRPSLPKPGKDK